MSEGIYDLGIALMRRKKMRITEPRKALLQCLIDAKQPTTADALHEQLGKSDYDLVTVYRNLDAFEKVGVVQRLMTESGTTLFEVLDDSEHHHHHILCRKCHKAECLDICEMEKFEGLAKELGYSEVTHVLELYGVCAECREAE